MRVLRQGCWDSMRTIVAADRCVAATTAVTVVIVVIVVIADIVIVDITVVYCALYDIITWNFFLFFFQVRDFNTFKSA